MLVSSIQIIRCTWVALGGPIILRCQATILEGFVMIPWRKTPKWDDNKGTLICRPRWHQTLGNAEASPDSHGCLAQCVLLKLDFWQPYNCHIDLIGATIGWTIQARLDGYPPGMRHHHFGHLSIAATGLVNVRFGGFVSQCLTSLQKYLKHISWRWTHTHTIVTIQSGGWCQNLWHLLSGKLT